MINFPAKISHRCAKWMESQKEVTLKMLTVGGLREITGVITDIFVRNDEEFLKLNNKTISMEEVVYVEGEYVFFGLQDKHQTFLELNFSNCAPMIPANGRKVVNLDLSSMEGLDPTVYVEKATNNWTDIAIGGYLERRKMYESSQLYKQEHFRNTHLGVDIWCNAGTDIIAPIDGVFYGITDNQGKGDYGPTILLKHNVQGCSFFTLYGHLSRESIQGLQPGNIVRSGQKLAALGNYEENGNWPPHLHFQVILDILGMYDDFPGVCMESEAEFFASVCPNPMTLIKW